MSLQNMGKAAKDAAHQLAVTSTSNKNRALAIIADELDAQQSAILAANQSDLAAAREADMDPAMLDRLTLTPDRLTNMASDVRQVIALADPVGQMLDHKLLENGMSLSKRREPLGVIGVIYEARPNVTIDIAALCLKTGNAAILRGGKETFATNQVLVRVIQTGLEKAGLPHASVQYIEKPDRALVSELLTLDDYVDMIIPRGGAGLHKMCKQNSTIPVIIGGFGISHLYVDHSADLDRAPDVILNAKTDRPSACNALDTLLVHKDVAAQLFARLLTAFNQHGLHIVAGSSALPYLDGVAKLREAQSGDFDTEWLGPTLGVVVVDSVDEALVHMRAHNASHSDAILTNDLQAAETFINGAGSAAVYVNASTRFTDGAQFGLGAEVAVSTQKLHARGPMGLEELTTYKWVGRADYLSRH
ncbi:MULTISPECIES: glutamate-5-semialdehyde dehydrogenase [unclassified Salinivibrio]|uniref:glutamate-5-semialdehyde dehydrogenase n=1 Tax=unclassified Salinivibrio TaxID=2636825 RepID=UPI00128D986B|nr:MULTISPECIES: glutamate-5-semialdehyde dehydrogenase [unclassified Salinivibrio]MPS31807.1 glutamate-5-semialdehyde dehydrogenase [Salinivibrio sp. VYel7]MPX93201.1 glutamate-5-semialdehyde dehydrogenase [Salinivibrio sp. VYel9]MPX95972.1 glutamate-5-semialdehyde dehydrogenase [Salinivibrio sp. VYel6]MPX99419.1 glutamate-5-semialdehyde dehydrogenase [Salinivibrio sp. VYel4]MPY02731.1 glutamate-5-semialdehyde dehydrogenase [Salinivibrio sp. VYel5]